MAALAPAPLDSGQPSAKPRDQVTFSGNFHDQLPTQAEMKQYRRCLRAAAAALAVGARFAGTAIAPSLLTREVEREFGNGRRYAQADCSRSAQEQLFATQQDIATAGATYVGAVHGVINQKKLSVAAINSRMAS